MLPALAALLVFVALAALYSTSALTTFDEDATAWARSLPGWSHDVARAVGALGGRVVLPVLVGGSFIALLVARRRADAVFLAVAVGGSDLILHLLKLLLDRDRVGEGVTLPAEAAFPAGHATTAVTAYVATALLVRRASAPPRAATLVPVVAAGLLATAVAASQVILLRRTAVEIAAGASLGVAWLLGCILARRLLETSSPRRTLALGAVTASGLTLFLAIASAIDQPRLVRLDRRVAERLAEGIPGWVEWPARAATWAGGGAGMAVVAFAAAVTFLRSTRSRRVALLPPLAYLLAQGLTHAVKVAVDRPRPTLSNLVELPSTAAFPSGHAAAAVAVLGVVAVLYARPGAARAGAAAAGVALALAALMIGASRVLLGVHWTTDVAGGIVLGLACAALTLLTRDLRRRAASADPECSVSQR
ncbi:MAG: phosphatase PAP2 family protein [Gaiella sp.]